jgi:tRNA-splicing ligase RtcB
MNSRQLLKLGVPATCVKSAITAIQHAVASGAVRGKEVRPLLSRILRAPADYLHHPQFAALAQELVADLDHVDQDPIPYRTWGADGIDDQSHQQMRTACSLPCARQAALMPDAHVGYGLPIGGVLGCEHAVIPYAVGVDIACRMKLSLLDMPVESLGTKFDQYQNALDRGTRFGVGVRYDKPQSHSVMDRDWSITRVTRENRDKAWQQLGTSGSGNHFVEFGVLSLPRDDGELGLLAGDYVGLLSHSGSRGAGAAVCSTYSQIARQRLPKRFERFGRLAWLEMDSEAGQEYWAAMNLMGEYAAANHAVIHRQITRLLGATIIGGVENHHNFAWKERHGDRDLYVHRKGATPAGQGVLGVIPGSMNDPAFVVRGKGNPASLDSASHGAGRVMSRKAAKSKFNFRAVRNDLRQQGVIVLSAGADEVPGVYKDIREVMRQQTDLVETVARFDPRIVKMCGDGSRAED